MHARVDAAAAAGRRRASATTVHAHSPTASVTWNAPVGRSGSSGSPARAGVPHGQDAAPCQ